MPGRKRFEQSADIGVLRDDGVRPVAHLPEPALLQIERQALVARSGIAAGERLPGEVVRLDRVILDQAEQAIVQHVGERALASQEIALARRSATGTGR